MNAYIAGGRLGDFIHTLYVPYTIYHTQNIEGDIYITDSEEYGSVAFHLRIDRTFAEISAFIKVCAPYIKNVYLLEHTPIEEENYRSVINLNDWRKLSGTCEWLLLLHDTYQIPIHGNPWCYPSSINWEKPYSDRYAVFHRSLRRHNPLFPWDTISQQLVQSGMKLIFVTCELEEYMYFPLRHQVQLQLCSDITEMAKWIYHADIMVGNQSAPMALSLSLGKRSIVEVHPDEPGDIIAYANTTMANGEVYCYLNDKVYRRVSIL